MSEHRADDHTDRQGLATTAPAGVLQPKPWQFDVDEHGNFWFVSDTPESDDWAVTLTCKITRGTQTESPTKAFLNIAGRSRRNAWQVTPFTDYGYARIEVRPGDGDSFVAVEGYRYP